MNISEERRQAIVQEIADLLPRRIMREPYMFTAADVAAHVGRAYSLVLANLKRLAGEGKLRMEPDGFDVMTGRKVTLFWRPEDEPPQAE